MPTPSAGSAWLGVGVKQRGIIRKSAQWTLCQHRHKTHSTGPEKRLSRESATESAEFGSVLYSKEELIAEIGGATSAPKQESQTRSSRIKLLHHRLGDKLMSSPFFK